MKSKESTPSITKKIQTILATAPECVAAKGEFVSIDRSSKKLYLQIETAEGGSLVTVDDQEGYATWN